MSFLQGILKLNPLLSELPAPSAPSEEALPKVLLHFFCISWKPEYPIATAVRERDEVLMPIFRKYIYR